MTRGVNYGSGSHCLSTQDAECDQYDDSEADFCVKCDNSAEADSPRGGSISDDAAASLETKVNSVAETLLISSPSSHPKQKPTDPGSLRKTALVRLIEQDVNIDGTQKERLFQVLVKYLEYMTARPGKCSLCKYKFQVETDRPVVGYSRCIPFSVRPAVREQLTQTLNDGILEISNSPFLNPSTIVNREGKKPRICIDAHKINQFTIPDYERTPPLQEPSQRFEGARYTCMSSTDLSPAYLQVESFMKTPENIQLFCSIPQSINISEFLMDSRIHYQHL